MEAQARREWHNQGAITLHETSIGCGACESWPQVRVCQTQSLPSSTSQVLASTAPPQPPLQPMSLIEARSPSPAIPQPSSEVEESSSLQLRALLNCYPGHGATAIDESPVQHILSVKDCQELCKATPGCQGVVVSTGTAATTDCYRRSNIDTFRCQESSTFDLYYDPDYYSLTPEVAAVLNSEYSTALYGAVGVLDISRMRTPPVARASTR